MDVFGYDSRGSITRSDRKNGRTDVALVVAVFLFAFLTVILGITLAIELSHRSSDVTTAADCVLMARDGSTVHGHVKLYRSVMGTKIEGSFKGLVPYTVHGVHIHAYGDEHLQGQPFSIGPIFNPSAERHGCLDSDEHQAGVLGNMMVDENGEVTMNIISNRFTVSEVLGRALAIKSGRDDCVTQPDGASGPAIAACTIEIATNLSPTLIHDASVASGASGATHHAASAAAANILGSQTKKHTLKTTQPPSPETVAADERKAAEIAAAATSHTDTQQDPSTAAAAVTTTNKGDSFHDRLSGAKRGNSTHKAVSAKDSTLHEKDPAFHAKLAAEQRKRRQLTVQGSPRKGKIAPPHPPGPDTASTNNATESKHAANKNK
jgi:superoxide dismutase, Cu-Zn family